MNNNLALLLHYVTKFLIIGILILITSSCSEKPNSTGINLLNPEDFIEVKSFDTRRDSAYSSSSSLKQIENLGTSRRILVGKYDKITARSLVRFGYEFSSDLKNWLNENKIEILSAKLMLYPVYRFGDSTLTNFGFNVYEITSWWESNSFTSDSLSSSNFQYKPNPIQTNFSNTDTLVTCLLPNEKVLSWMKAYADTAVQDAPGILIEPTDETNFIRGFSSSNVSLYTSIPTIEIVYRMTDTSDTLFAAPIADVYTISTTKTFNDPKVIYLQSGVVFKNKLYFDLGQIPQNSIINSAKLELTKIKNKSVFGTSYQDSLFAVRLIDTVNLTVDSTYRGVILSVNTTTMEGNISRIVQDWINGEPNYGIMLSIVDPDGGAELFAFEGSESDNIDQRPRLKIFYTIKKNY